jgi:hypothetical protein
MSTQIEAAELIPLPLFFGWESPLRRRSELSPSPPEGNLQCDQQRTMPAERTANGSATPVAPPSHTVPAQPPASPARRESAKHTRPRLVEESQSRGYCADGRALRSLRFRSGEGVPQRSARGLLGAEPPNFGGYR